ncbi:MAG: isoleucine--tRNA ligase [Chloroherpetonaceae bacterium]|nr:isoleucine--tRNA ligase [Chthonomonadaceae bacterium]MDW8208084.1 isoleucine--tRNA ligase [Chloroherpetonaceae bacterium]
MSNENRRDYRRTLHLPLSDKDPGAFPQRGNLPAREPEFQQRWARMDLYRKSLRKPAPRGTFILHDGPPYSNGDIHLGHALNKIAKDITTRFRTMQGYCAPYVPGWDNHGMPIENAVARRFREAQQQPDRVTLRRACREYAAHWIEVQRAQFQRLGVRGDWDHPYLTMSNAFEARIVEVFGELAAQGFIYRGLKPVLWCATCETALADAEVEYAPHISSSIYVRFPLRRDPEGRLTDLPAPYCLIWTTTPWTIPANLAVAVHPDATYVAVQSGDRTYLVAEPLLEMTLQAIGVEEHRVLRTFRGCDLEGIQFQHPLFDRPSPVVLASYVTMDAGTGIVHTAPGHGKEDFDTGLRYGLEVLNPVGPDGRYTEAAGACNGRSFQGLRVIPDRAGQDSEANRAVTEALREAGHLLHESRYEHSYPHCWRCHSPLVFRATVQWFMNVDHAGFRQRALEAIQQVTWFPKESINRITSMVAHRPDWCVSRQRSWGVGIPAFYCNRCEGAILTPESVAAVAALVRREGSDAWYVASPVEILPPGFRCPHCGAGAEDLRKETDVLDVWFDSGSTHRAVLEAQDVWPELRWPADVYLEGGDQHRGWFNSSLMIAVATKGAAPYRQVVTNGWTLDENGEAFSKSKGNGVNPLDVIAVFGADVLRCWVASQNFMEDTRCGDNLLRQVGEFYRGIRNTFRFLVNNLYDFDPATDAVPVEALEALDRWALERLNLLVQECTEAYEVYEYHRVFHAVFQFCTVELSAFYLDVLKDRLYASGRVSRERRSAQTALHRLAETLARVLAPILVHTAEEVWDYLKMPGKPESVHLADFPTAGPPDADLLARWEPVLALRESVKKALEEKRVSREAYAALSEAERAQVLVNTLEAHVDLWADEATYRQLQPFESQLSALFVVSQVTLRGGRPEPGVHITVAPAQGVKCARCWLVRPDVGVDPAHPEICARCAAAIA